jgi:hypothetical protein
MMRNDIEDRPFEESIVGAIREARTQQHFAFCAIIIERTILRFNHDEIAAVFSQSLAEQSIRDAHGGHFGVVASVMRRKAAMNRDNS